MTKSTRTTRVVAVLLAAALALTAGGCAKWSEDGQDAPRTGSRNTAPADIINMPDGFSNVGTKCDHGNRVYVAFHGGSASASIAVVPNDPSCAR